MVGSIHGNPEPPERTSVHTANDPAISKSHTPSSTASSVSECGSISNPRTNEGDANGQDEPVYNNPGKTLLIQDDSHMVNLKPMMESHIVNHPLASPNGCTPNFRKVISTDNTDDSKLCPMVNQDATTESESPSASIAQTEPYPDTRKPKGTSGEPCLVTVSPPEP